jgi:predicted NUDIX family NTP pyrophosphohydrolase
MKYSAGIIPFRKNDNGEMEFLLGHPGGDMWQRIDYWSFLKGGVEKNETWTDAAIREFKEESGLTMDDCDSSMLIPLGTALQNPRKTVIAYGLHYPNIDTSKCHSNMANNGINVEIDRYKWMTYKELESRTHETHLIFYKKLIDLDEYYSKDRSDMENG